jgi:ribonuclease T2
MLQGMLGGNALMNKFFSAGAFKCLIFTLVIISAASTASGPSDYWGVPLSWSPEYCHAEPSASRELQCAEAHNFVLGGFEPFSNSGPADPCPKQYSDIPLNVIERMLPVMWNKTSITSQWRRYGSCSGLDMMEYFVEADFIARKVVIPAAYTAPFGYVDTTVENVKSRFVEANPGLNTSSITLRCDREWLRDVVVCVDKNLEYHSCGTLPANGCRERIRLRGVDPRLKQPQDG